MATRRERTGVQLAERYTVTRMLRWKVPNVIIQPKYDGFRCRAVVNRYEEKTVTLYSSTGLELDCAHVGEEMLAANWPRGEFDGELLHPTEPFSITQSLVKRPQERSAELVFVIFDVITHEPQLYRMEKLVSFDQVETEHVKISPWWVVPPYEQYVDKYLSMCVDAGYEGIVVRHPFTAYLEGKSTKAILKLKPRQEMLLKIVGSTEERTQEGVPKGTLGALLCTTTTDPPIAVSVGSGFTALQRAKFWQVREELVGCVVSVYYQERTVAGSLRFPIFKELHYE